MNRDYIRQCTNKCGGPEGRAMRRCLCDDVDAPMDDVDASVDDVDAPMDS